MSNVYRVQIMTPNEQFVTELAVGFDGQVAVECDGHAGGCHCRGWRWARPVAAKRVAQHTGTTVFGPQTPRDLVEKLRGMVKVQTDACDMFKREWMKYAHALIRLQHALGLTGDGLGNLGEGQDDVDAMLAEVRRLRTPETRA